MQPFEAGQVWAYRTRPGEEASRVTVCRVESYPKLGTVVHVSVDGLRMKNPHSPGGVSETAGHLPFAEAALRDSVTGAPEAREVPSDYLNGYDAWKQAFDAGKAGVWGTPLADAIAAMESALNAHRQR